MEGKFVCKFFWVKSVWIFVLKFEVNIWWKCCLMCWWSSLWFVGVMVNWCIWYGRVFFDVCVSFVKVLFEMKKIFSVWESFCGLFGWIFVVVIGFIFWSWWCNDF